MCFHGRIAAQGLFINIFFEGSTIVPTQFSCIFRKCFIEFNTVSFMIQGAKAEPKSQRTFFTFDHDGVISGFGRNMYQFVFLQKFRIYIRLGDFLPIDINHSLILCTKIEMRIITVRIVLGISIGVIAELCLRKNLVKIYHNTTGSFASEALVGICSVI